MRLHNFPPALVCLVAAIVAPPTIAGLIPNPFEQLPSLEDQQDLQKRCANPCGYYGQLCCESNEYCYTDSNNEAQCGVSQSTAAPAQGGSWIYYTTTYVETDLQTITTVYSSYQPAVTTAVVTASCLYSQGETSCGSCCCLSGQYCASAGVCKAVNGGGNSGYYSSLVTVTTLITQSATAPARGTSDSVITVTSTGVVTGTQPFQTPVGTAGIIVGSQSTSSSHGLSAGAIAGIVIGVIIAIIILLLCCACFCFKEIFDGILSLFGLGKTRRTETEVIEERRSSRHGNARRTWFGSRPSRPAREESGGGGLLAVGGLLATMAVILGLKRRHDRKEEEKSQVSGYSYYDSEYTSSSSASSGDRRTRRSASRGPSRSRSRVSRP